MAGNEIAKLSAKIDIDTRNFERKFQLIKGGLQDADKQLGKTANGFQKVGAIMNGWTTTALIGVGVALTAISGKALKIASDFEQLGISFEIFTGGKEAGDALVKSLTDLANVTPMTTAGLADNAKLLLSFGEATENIIPDLKMLGDVSGGNQQKMDLLALAYAQSGAAGRLMGQDLRQMINAGFNPLQSMAVKTGKSIGQLTEEMEKGLIPFSMVKQAFKDATSEGGRFYQMMDKQSQTLQGRLSTLADKFTLVGKNIGDALLPAGKRAVEVLIRIADAALNATNAINKLLIAQGALAGSSNMDKALRMQVQMDKLQKKMGTQNNIMGAFKSSSPQFKDAKKANDILKKQFQDLQKEQNGLIAGAAKASLRQPETATTGGFKDSGKSSSGGGRTKKAKTASASSLLNDRIQMIQAQSAYEIARSNATDEAILQKKIATQARITALYQKGSVDYIQSQTTGLELTNQLEDLKVQKAKEAADKKAQIAQEGADREKAAGKRVSDSLTDGLRSAVDGTKTVSEAFKDMISNMLITLAQSAIEKKIQSLFQGASSGNAAGGNWAQTLFNIGTKFFGFANGGYPDTSKPFIAGERGAELIVPTNKTKVFTNKETNGILGGGSSSEGGTTMQPVIVSNTFKVETMNGDNVVKTLQLPESKVQVLKMMSDAIRFNQGGVRNDIKNV